MIPADERAERVKAFTRRLRWKGPVFAVSALTREGLRGARACRLRARRGRDAAAGRSARSPLRSGRRRFRAMSAALRGARRIVVKVGSSLVTNEGRGIDSNAVGDWCRQMAELVRSGPRARDGVERRNRRRHEAARLAGAPARRARAPGGRRGRPDGTCADLRVGAARARHRQRAGAAHPCRPRRPRALPERALDARHAARARRRSGHQRERHGRQRRDQVRRQRHARRARHQPARCRRARDPHRPGGPVLGRPAPRRERAARRARQPRAILRSSRWPAARDRRSAVAACSPRCSRPSARRAAARAR